MAKNRYSGVDSYVAFFIAYKAKILTRMPIFTPNDYDDLQQELMLAYLHAWPEFDPAKGDRRSFIKTVVNTKALMLVRDAERQKRWTGARVMSLSMPVSEGESYVEDRIQSAARTLRRMPDVKVQGYFSTWPTIIREPLEILQMEPEPMRLYPSQKSITDMEEVLFEWLKWLEPDERRLVWLRAERVRWKLICARFGVGRTKAWEMYRRALARIAAKIR